MIWNPQYGDHSGLYEDGYDDFVAKKESKMYPIIMTGESVRAILDGRKTQTRRIIKPQPIGYRTCWSDDLEDGDVYIETDGSLWKACESKGRNKRVAGELTPVEIKSPYGVVGDRLWVRETWLLYNHMGQYIGKAPKTKPDDLDIGYKADGVGTKEGLLEVWPWRSPIFMPKWACRIWLEITGIKVERVQEISASDILEEGTLTRNYPDLAQSKEQLQWLWDRFRKLWDSLNAKRGYSWESNPWVWVLEFRKVNNAK